MKRTIFLFSIIAILCMGWSAAWFYIEGKVVETADKAKERLAQRDQLLDCTDQQTGGYPFRITFDCSRLSYQNERSGFSIETGALRSAAQAYQPGKVVVEVEAPGALETLGSGRFKLDWDSMRASAKFGLSGRDSTSLVSENFTLTPLNDPSVVTISQLEYHDRLLGENDVQIAVTTLGLKEASSTTLDLIDFDMRSELSLRNVHDEYSRGRNLMDVIRARGLEGDLERLHIAAANGAELKFSGPFNAKKTGRLDAALKVEIKDLEALVRLVSFLNPGQEKVIAQAAQTIKLVAPVDAGGVHTIDLSVQENVLKLGIIPIGRLPFWL